MHGRDDWIEDEYLLPVDSGLQISAKLNPTARIEVPPVLRVVKQRARLMRFGPSFGPEPLVAANSAHNALVALTRRALRETPVCNSIDLEDFRSFIFGNVETLFNGVVQPVESLPYTQWVSNFPPSIQKLRHQARANIAANIRTDHHTMCQVKGFVKFNELLTDKVRPDNLDLEFKPRLISAGTQEYQTLCGPWVSAFQREIARRWNVDFSILVTAGLSGEQIGGWFHRHTSSPHLTEGDYEAFDSSQSEGIRRLMIDVHELFGCPPEILAAQRNKIVKRGTLRSGIKFYVRGTMASGDPETYIDNSILNALLMVYAYSKHYSISASAALSELRLVVAGDDNLTFSKRSVVELSSIILRLGMQNVMVQRDRPEDAEFCSAIFWPATLPNGTDTHVLAPKPGRILNKLFWLQSGHKQPLVELKGKMLGIVRGVSCVPFLHELVVGFLRRTGGVKAQAKYDRYAITNGFQHFFTPNAAAWNVFHHRTGLSRDSANELVGKILDGFGKSLASVALLDMIRREW